MNNKGYGLVPSVGLNTNQQNGKGTQLKLFLFLYQERTTLLIMPSLSFSVFLLASWYFCFKEELDSFSMKLNKMSSSLSDVAATSNSNELSSYDDYHLVVDPEYKAYIRQKKKLNEQIHDHWKLELVKHVSKQAS